MGADLSHGPGVSGRRGSITARRLPGAEETIPQYWRNHFPGRKKTRGNRQGLTFCSDQQRGSIMWAIFNIMYREYCRARLVEIRKFTLQNGALS
jgi:hypothetical protein